MTKKTNIENATKLADGLHDKFFKERAHSAVAKNKLEKEEIEEIIRLELAHNEDHVSIHDYENRVMDYKMMNAVTNALYVHNDFLREAAIKSIIDFIDQELQKKPLREEYKTFLENYKKRLTGPRI